jgi:hypothetical protein
LTYSAAQRCEFSSIGTVIPNVENHGRMVVSFRVELGALAVRKYARTILLTCEFLLKEDDDTDG